MVFYAKLKVIGKEFSCIKFYPKCKEETMGSRIMHLIIAHKIADCLAIEKRKEFLLGSIAPDATANKNVSHFFVGKTVNYTRSVDYKGFLHKYQNHCSSYYHLGYYTHLIADDIWLKGFYLPWLRNRIEKNSETLALYHQDFKVLNSLLIRHYQLQGAFRELRGGSIPELDEVTSQEIVDFIPYVVSDLNYDKEQINEKLHIFTFDQILGYIETAVELGVLNLKDKV